MLVLTFYPSSLLLILDELKLGKKKKKEKKVIAPETLDDAGSALSNFFFSRTFRARKIKSKGLLHLLHQN